jgi:hypothetical protein
MQVCANFQGTLQDHTNLQTALKGIKEAVKPAPAVVEKEDKVEA